MGEGRSLPQKSHFLLDLAFHEVPAGRRCWTDRVWFLTPDFELWTYGESSSLSESHSLTCNGTVTPGGPKD